MRQQVAVMRKGKWIKGKENARKHVLYTKNYSTVSWSVHDIGTVQWSDMTVHLPSLHLIAILWRFGSYLHDCEFPLWHSRAQI